MSQSDGPSEGTQFNPQTGFPVPSGDQSPPAPPPPPPSNPGPPIGYVPGQPFPPGQYPPQDASGQQAYAPPPYAQQPPYPPQAYGQQQPTPQPWYPQQGYGQPYGAYESYAKPDLPQASTAMILGLVAVIGAFFSCGLTLFLSPFAWVTGQRARKALAQSPNGPYGGESKATTGFVLGIIGTVLLVLALIAIVVVIAVAVTTHTTTTYSSGFGTSA